MTDALLLPMLNTHALNGVSLTDTIANDPIFISTRDSEQNRIATLKQDINDADALSERALEDCVAKLLTIKEYLNLSGDNQQSGIALSLPRNYSDSKVQNITLYIPASQADATQGSRSAFVVNAQAHIDNIEHITFSCVSMQFEDPRDHHNNDDDNDDNYNEPTRFETLEDVAMHQEAFNIASRFTRILLGDKDGIDTLTPLKEAIKSTVNHLSLKNELFTYRSAYGNNIMREWRAQYRTAQFDDIKALYQGEHGQTLTMVRCSANTDDSRPVGSRVLASFFYCQLTLKIENGAREIVVNRNNSFCSYTHRQIKNLNEALLTQKTPNDSTSAFLANSLLVDNSTDHKLFGRSIVIIPTPNA